MKQILYILFIITLFGCLTDKKTLKYVCDCDQLKEVQLFVKSTIKDANNMSDEEMEDVIKELTNTGIKLNCSQEFIWTDHNGNILPDEVDSCKTIFSQYL